MLPYSSTHALEFFPRGFTSGHLIIMLTTIKQNQIWWPLRYKQVFVNTSVFQSPKAPVYSCSMFGKSLMVDFSKIVSPAHRVLFDTFQIPQSVTSQYKAHTQKIFVDFERFHTPQCRIHLHKGYKKFSKSLHAIILCPDTAAFPFWK